MSAQYFDSLYFGHVITAVILYGLIVSFKFASWLKIAWDENGTLSTVPGPKIAKWTRLWIVKALASGKSHEIFVDTNQRYGPLARIGPNHLITSDPSTTRRILGARSRYARGPFFDSIRIDPNVPNIVSQRDHKRHAQLKSKLLPSFNGKSVISMEPVIDDRLMDWISRVKARCASGQKNTCIDIGSRIQFLTVDIITKIILGEELGCVAADGDKYEFLETVERGNAVCQHLSVLLELNDLMYWLSKVPMFGKYLVPKASDNSGVGRIMGIVRKAVEKRKVDDKGSIDADMLLAFLKRGIPESQIDAEVTIGLVAGSDTTSTAVQSTFLAIVLNPRVYHTLKAEIQSAVSKGAVSYPIKDFESKQLRYLQACVLEGLRKFPPLSQLRERVVPEGGDLIHGHRIPAGTYIGLNAWGTQLDSVYGDDPETFRPERWLIDDEARLEAMHRTHGLIFGHGATKCLGMAMAMMELNKMIFELFRNFDVSIANPYRPWSSVCYGIFFQSNFNVNLSIANGAKTSSFV